MSNKKSLWKIHAWLGLYVGAMILLFSITGSFIVFRAELDAILNPTLYKVTESKEKTVSLDGISKKVLLKYPNYYLHHFKFNGENKPFEVKIKPVKNYAKDKKKKDLDIFINPANGEINGIREPESGLLYWVAKLHTNLLAGKIGRYIVGLFGLALLIMLVIGLFIYGNFMKKKRMTQIRWGEGTRKISADWHKLLGITTVPFNLIWAITGITFAFLPNILEATIGKPNQTFAKPATLTKPIAIKPFSYDQIVNSVVLNFPDAKIKTIREAYNDNPFIEVKLDYNSPLIKDDAAKLYIDKDRKEIISHFDPRLASLGTKLFYSQDPLHFGTFAGLWSKIIYSLFGLSSGILFITGFVIYRKRKQTKNKINFSKCQTHLQL
ncbi:PepSY-associated TM helix domain-containing protein [Flavobacterium piscis]|uniref:Iron-regulated membrane protein n=1 Tax=Flavobacterium piscis TaxID=1114874 RepID=A0ABU1Y786_9FLAO|nr:PepSY-associated TM helix domain-containing protein [Flavobacterium piscis]MDR7210092.1 putative iron-regulated membrane protein [Flavobacterium piscis]